MPGFDGTGPRGMGSMTGGGRGFCSPQGRSPGVAPRAGYGYRAGWGFNPCVSRVTNEQELDFLKDQAQVMREHLEQIEAMIKQIASQA